MVAVVLRCVVVGVGIRGVSGGEVAGALILILCFCLAAVQESSKAMTMKMRRT